VLVPELPEELELEVAPEEEVELEELEELDELEEDEALEEASEEEGASEGAKTSDDSRIGVADSSLALILSMCCTTSENPGGATLGGARGAGGATLGGRSMRQSFHRAIALHVLQALYHVCERGH
jgi:hypothetical protein